MNDDPWTIDLARGVGPLELGATREEIVRRLAEAKVEFEDDEEEPQWLYVGEYDAELTFTKARPPTLREIVVEDERVRLGPLPVIGRRLHEVLDTLQVPEGETLWRLEGDELPSGGGQLPIPPSDEELFRRGTLWITSLGLGLGMLYGDISTVHLRRPDGVPRRGIGPWTPAQRALSRRSDLDSRLVRASVPGAAGRSWFRFWSGLALAAALGLIVWRAIEYQRRWNAAPVAEGVVVDLQPGPPDPFPSEFTIAYTDQAGQPHQVVLHPADVYLVRNLGDKVELRYLPEAPDKPLGPARFRDAAFQEFMPWGMGVFGAYLVLQFVHSLIVWLLPARQASAPEPESKT